MNVRHCNDCGGTDDVSEVSLGATRLTDADETGLLGRTDRTLVEGDLCAACLKVVVEMIREKEDLPVAWMPRRPDMSEVT